ncbi:hypothetical protein [Bosea sp. OK403]|uniref:hypothetical protein n=1 Tax=Bosea sp. OK403 TaxID=1855286 RepID=UPI000B87ED53|nr:hypothetical protein [Bosea sp. OK403]
MAAALPQGFRQVLAEIRRVQALSVTSWAALSPAEAQGTLGGRQTGKGEISRLAIGPSATGVKACGGMVGAAVSMPLTGSASVITRRSFGRGAFARLSCERRNANDSFELRPIARFDKALLTQSP